MAATEKPATEKKKAEGGAWVVVDDANTVLSVERSEVRALRIAVDAKGRVVRWGFGKLRAEVLG
jgi:hypothetical protein